LHARTTGPSIATRNMKIGPLTPRRGGVRGQIVKKNTKKVS
jgi:hypothetical protein